MVNLQHHVIIDTLLSLMINLDIIIDIVSMIKLEIEPVMTIMDTVIDIVSKMKVRVEQIIENLDIVSK